MNPATLLKSSLGMIVGFAALLLLSGCASVTSPAPLTRYEFEQPHMGTLFKVTLYATNEPSARLASDAAFSKIAALDRMMTDYDPDSELMTLCRQPINKPVKVSDDLFTVFEESLRIARASDGAFDPTIGPVIRQWRRARRQETLPTPEQIEHTQKSVGWQKLVLDLTNQTATLLAPDMQLDLGGIAKGYAADKALAVLRENGISRALVAASGDIAAGDAPPGQKGWRVTIGTPYSGSNSSRSFLLSNTAVSTSGDTEQFVVIGGHRYSHIVNPHTGIGLTNQLQVSVISRHAVHTDALSTTVCVLGEERGFDFIKHFPQAVAMILRYENGKLEFKASGQMGELPGVIEE